MKDNSKVIKKLLITHKKYSSSFDIQMLSDISIIKTQSDYKPHKREEINFSIEKTDINKEKLIIDYLN
ncbi:MAG TPA: hypothetical protein PL110_13520, partial [Candidatus Eremiobacteraeota bacterium]|nr:hypothetical protein [Candidatus Eremiobacteraeota bacterium]